MEYNGDYMNGGYGGSFRFEDPLWEDENEDIHHAVECSILESNNAEMYFVESSYRDEDEHHAGSIQGSIDHSDESMRKASRTPRRSWWRKLFSSLNIFKKPKQCDVTSWESSTSESDSNYQIDRVCDVCDEAILSDQLTSEYWRQKVCDKHLSDGSTKCCSCKRVKIGNMRYIRLSDGRKLCSDCRCTAIMDTKSCIPLFHEVYRFLEGIHMKILEDIPISLVSNEEMKRISSELGGEDQPAGNLLGVTTYEAAFVVRSVARSYQRGENIHVEEEVHYINEVTSILIVYGFPRLAIGSTIAHEMTHAWMRMEGYSERLKLEVEEGICQVMAHKWLDWYAFVGDDFLRTTPEQAEFLRNLKEVWKNKIETRYDKVYGGGFREAKWAIERYGLRRTMDHVAQTGNFPQ